MQIARAIAHRPTVLFLDEPWGRGLDPQSRMAMWPAVEGLRAEGTPSIAHMPWWAVLAALIFFTVALGRRRGCGLKMASPERGSFPPGLSSAVLAQKPAAKTAVIRQKDL